MLKAYKYRIYPSKEQRTLFSKTFGCVRFIYNTMLAERKELYEEHKGDKQALKDNKPKTYSQWKKEFEWLYEVDNLALANAQINLQTAYNNFFRTKRGFPKFKSKHKDKLSYTTNNQKGTVRIEGNEIRLPKVGMVKIKMHRQPPCGVLKSATISNTSSGKYYASLLYDIPHDVEKVEPEEFLGLDFAMDGLFVDSNGDFAYYPKFYRKAQVKLAKQQRKMSRKKNGSSNRNKQRVKVAKLHEHIANQRKDFLHKQSATIAKLYDVVCIEDLNMRGMSQALNFGKSVSDNGWGMFTTFLGYKLGEQGKQLVKIDKWFPSTKMCSACGCLQDMPLSKRWYSCGCGFECDRDHNSAINIRNEGKRLVT